MATVHEPITGHSLPPGEEHIRLRAVGWTAYRTIAEALRGHHVRLTYDRGTLELMTISHPHGNLSRLLGRLIVVLTEECGLPIHSCGDMSCDRESLDRGLQPDECFYIEHAPQVRDKQEIDLATDPPPDLAVEIDISRDSRTRLGIYAALGVPEVWRYDEDTLEVYRLGPDGEYALNEASQHFPQVAVGELVKFLQQRTQVEENELVRTFREWVGRQLGRADQGT